MKNVPILPCLMATLAFAPSASASIIPTNNTFFVGRLGQDGEKTIHELVNLSGSKMRARKTIEELNSMEGGNDSNHGGDNMVRLREERNRLLWDYRYDFGNRTEAYVEETIQTLSDEMCANDDWVGASLTTREYTAKFEVIYTNPNRTFFSYCAEGYFYTGGMHGSSSIRLGTIDLKTGRKLGVADVIPGDKQGEALARVKAAAINKLEGKDNVQGEITLTENFCVCEDGLHFLFQEYESAAYCHGPVEVVIPAYGKYRALNKPQ